MKLAIDIPDEVYEFLVHKLYLPKGFDVTRILINGAPIEGCDTVFTK